MTDSATTVTRRRWHSNQPSFGRRVHNESAILQAFKGDSEPVLQQKESLDLTKKILGVEFQGSRKVLHPKSSEAKLVQ